MIHPGSKGWSSRLALLGMAPICVLVALAPTFESGALLGIVALIALVSATQHLPWRQSSVVVLRQSFNRDTWYVVALGLIILGVGILQVKYGSSSGGRARSGHAQALDPGRITSLALDDRIAFIARLSHPNIPKANLYWRLHALTEAGDMRWAARGNQPSYPPPAQESDAATARLVHQHILLEGLKRTNLFPALEYQQFRRTPGASAPSKMISYDAWSDVAHTSGDLLSERARQAGVALNMSPSNDLKGLATQLKRNGVEETLRAIDEFLIQNQFRYRLKLPHEVPTVDSFFFRARFGFCEHYAASTATLLRLMGYPTRVVVGYQGGLRNKLSGTIVVRNLDAHAWVEAWSEKSLAWVRYDPTLAVSPSRVLLGASAWLEGQGLKDENLASELWTLWAEEAAIQWEALSTQWLESWPVKRLELLISRVLSQSLAVDLTFMTSTAALILGALGYYLRRWRLHRKSPAKSAYRTLVQKLSGNRPLPLATTIDQFCATHGADRDSPEASPLREFAVLYNRLAYGRGPTSRDALRRLHQIARTIPRASVPSAGLDPRA